MSQIIRPEITATPDERKISLIGNMLSRAYFFSFVIIWALNFSLSHTVIYLAYTTGGYLFLFGLLGLHSENTTRLSIGEAIFCIAIIFVSPYLGVQLVLSNQLFLAKISPVLLRLIFGGLIFALCGFLISVIGSMFNPRLK